jgi:FkbM family methyltransferase
MSSITLKDFIPPLLPRVLRYIVRKITNNNGPHPFNCVPKNIQAKLIIDIGANVGDVTIAALKTYPDCKVICFEPVNSTLNILYKNTSKYRNRVTIYNEALSSVNGNGHVNITSFHGANSIESQSKLHSEICQNVKEIGKQAITLVRLDDIARRFNGQKIDIMKIDVEGHEYDVILGGKDFIKNNVDTIIIEASLMRDASWEKQSIIEVFSLLSEMGFRWINAFDLHHVENSSLMCIQMDCVFRHKTYLK